jgi:uridine kinase
VPRPGPFLDRDLATATQAVKGRSYAGCECRADHRGDAAQRAELIEHWDLRIFVDIDFDEVLRRGIERDQAWMGSADQARARYLAKYIPGERLYLAEVRPAEQADLVVDNRDPANPVLAVR